MYKLAHGGPTNQCLAPKPYYPLVCLDEGQSSPFSQQWVTTNKQEHIDLRHRASYWEAQHRLLVMMIGIFHYAG